MQDVSEEFRTMLAALRAAVATPGDADRPGLLRQRLELALGPAESARLRRLVHQVVAASEENLAHDLRRISPLTTQSLQRLSADLASARGWTPEAAQRTTQLWASALGFADLASSSWPRERVGSPSAAPAPGQAAPPSATLLPDLPPAVPRPAHAEVAWPKIPKNFVRQHAANLQDEPVLGVALGYSGMSLPWCVGLAVTMTVVLCLPILFIGATGGVLPILGVAGAKVLVSRLGRGALTASASGLEFVPYDTALRTPRPEQAFGAVWSQVSVDAGRVSALGIAGRRIQVGPRNRAFVAAAAARAGSAR